MDCKLCRQYTSEWCGHNDGRGHNLRVLFARTAASAAAPPRMEFARSESFVSVEFDEKTAARAAAPACPILFSPRSRQLTTCGTKCTHLRRCARKTHAFASAASSGTVR